MDHNVPMSTALVHVHDLNLSVLPVQRLAPSKLFRYATLAASFEAVFLVLDAGLDRIRSWQDLVYTPNIVIFALILFISGVQENCKALSIDKDTSVAASPDVNEVDPSTILIQKVEILPTIIAEATYEAIIEAFHSLPYQLRNWGDLKEVSASLLQCLRTFVSVALTNYKTWVAARNFPASTLLDANDSQVSAILEAFESNIFKALDDLPDEVPCRQDIVRASQSLHRSFHLLNSRKQSVSYAALTSRAKCFYLRLCGIFCHSSQFADVFLNFCSLVHSLWDGRQLGPEVILPISSSSKRPSSRLARLLLHHTRDLSHRGYEADLALTSKTSYPWTVTMIDLNTVPPDIATGISGTGADVYGLTSMLFLVEILDFLLSPSWIILYFLLPPTMATWMFVSAYGDGTLTLLPPSGGLHASTPASALMLDEEFSIVLMGKQNLVESVTLGSFRFSYPVADLLQAPVWKVLVNLVLEGFFQGLLSLVAIVPLWRLVRPSFASPLSQVVGAPVLSNVFQLVTSWRSWQRAVRRFNEVSLEKTVQYFAEVFAEFIRSAARVAPLLISWFLYIHDYSIFNELQLIVALVPPLCLAFIFSVPSHNYPIRTRKFLDVLGNPPVKKWQFRTLAATATFQCLMVCHDIPRPVRDIDVRGVLDTLIPDQRDVWAAWKARVADRIIHEVDISFAPTLPTFRSTRLQKQLEELLDEAQYAYDMYRCWSKSTGPTDK